MKKLWNLIRSTKKDRSSNEDIAVSKLHEYFNTKLSISECESGVISNAKRSVQEKHEGLLNVEFNDKVISGSMVSGYKKKLHMGSAPGCDGITSEHLKHALSSGIDQYLSVMFSLCLKYGVVPTSFKKGLFLLWILVYRPIIDRSQYRVVYPRLLTCIYCKCRVNIS